MFDATKYDLRISTDTATDLFGNMFIEYHFTLVVDLVTWRQGVASSPAGVGRAVGDAVRDLAERHSLGRPSRA